MSDIAVRTDGLGKRYRLGGQPGAEIGGTRYSTLRETITDQAAGVVRRVGAMLRGDSRRSELAFDAGWLWALRDISIEIRRGEVMGVIGPNGAGKSTLLKILARIVKPTTGRAEIHGRAGALLEIGTGFHPELTGRENIYLNGAILGMGRAEIRRKFDQIVEFAEIERFLDVPVKRYSSGMAMRLAFSVAAHLEPDILLVDEVLAVGDAAFQKKCLGRVGDVAREGRTVLFVSHNLHAVLALCSQTFLLQAGKVIQHGPASEVVRQYLAMHASRATFDLGESASRPGDGSVRIVSLQIESTDPDGIIRSGSCLRVVLGYRSHDVVRFPQFVVSIYDQMDIGIFVLHNEFVGGLPDTLPPVGQVTCQTAPINLTPGRCAVHVELLKRSVRADYVPNAGFFDVEADASFGASAPPPRTWALCLLKHEWRVDTP
jgi:lipopolysaccharide transport system ATP-binding protein